MDSIFFLERSSWGFLFLVVWMQQFSGKQSIRFIPFILGLWILWWIDHQESLFLHFRGYFLIVIIFLLNWYYYMFFVHRWIEDGCTVWRLEIWNLSMVLTCLCGPPRHRKTLQTMATCIVRALIAKIRSNFAMLSRSTSICCLGVLCPTIKFGTNTVRMVRTNLPKSQCTPSMRTGMKQWRKQLTQK